MTKKIMERIKRAKDVSLISHERPDGDAIGSLLAMGLGLENLGKRVKMFTPDGLPKVYSFLSGSERIRRLSLSEVNSSDLCIFLDTANPERIGDGLDLKEIKTFIINIDHHVDNKLYGDVNFVDPSASATGELVYEVLREESDVITPEVADALYTAILTDSGRFSHNSTSPKTHIIVADLLSKGANKTRIAKHLYENKPFNLLKLIGKVLERAETAFNGKLVWSFLSEKELIKEGFEVVESESFLYFLRMSEGAKIVALFREMMDGRMRVSLRSNDENVNVRIIASQFGGGGHDMASACTIDANLKEAKGRIFDAIRKTLQWKE